MVSAEQEPRQSAFSAWARPDVAGVVLSASVARSSRACTVGRSQPRLDLVA